MSVCVYVIFLGVMVDMFSWSALIVGVSVNWVSGVVGGVNWSRVKTPTSVHPHDDFSVEWWVASQIYKKKKNQLMLPQQENRKLKTVIL